MTFDFKYWKTNGDLRIATGSIVGDSLTIARRCDEAFATGRAQMIVGSSLPEQRQNIPPYTLCQIDGDKYLMQSECTLYQTYKPNNAEQYVHDITITELTAVLECFIVGTKVLSSDEYDSTKMQKLCELMSTKYGVTFTLNTTTINNNTNPIASAKNEYRFANGTTLYDALTQISMRANCRPVVTDYTYNSNTKNITIGFIELSNLIVQGGDSGTIPTYINNIYEIHKDKVIQWTKTQSQDNYCKYLETEANNVIDTTNLAYDKCLSQRCIGESRITYDPEGGNGKIYTTSKINRVTQLKVKTHTYPVFNDMCGYDYFRTYVDEVDEESYYEVYYPDLVGTQKTLWQIVAGNSNQELYNFIVEWCNLVGANITDVMSKLYTFTYGGTYQFTHEGATYNDRYITMTPVTAYEVVSMPFDMTDYVLEKDQYMAEAETVRPQYVYYEQGNNVIDGLHKKPSYDMWQALAAFFTGSWNGDFISKARSLLTVDSGDIKSITHTGSMSGQVATISSTLTIPDSAEFDVEYEAITNPMIMNIKTDTPPNESSYKNFGRTYSVGASQIDFDKLVDSMNLSNDMLGKVEHTIELIVDDVTLPSELTYNYLLTAEVRYTDNSQNITNEKLGYILNYEIKYNIGYKSLVLYITSSVKNIANAIGIPYQYHATRLPIDNIVERPIRSKITMSTSNKNAIINNAGRLLVQFKFKDANNVETKIVSRGIVLTKGDKLYLYCEAEDQYAWGYKASVENQTVTINVPIKYADANNEIVSYSCNFGFFDITSEQSNDLPKSDLFSDNAFILTGVSNQKIYKDAYEKLTFTIEIK